MTGCNNFCAYCVVPHARGREVSRKPDEIAKEIKVLVRKGYKEIFLLGQNVNSYSSGKTNFSRLIKKIEAIPGKFWINHLSNHPKDITPEFINTVTKLKKVCELIHLPVQAGDDQVLKNMNRKYTAQEYLKLVSEIKKAFRKNKPGKLYAITSDIIVGFPGETKRQFERSAEIMKKVKYDMVFFGQYSPRPGTAAAKLKDNVLKNEKARREDTINEILKCSALANNKKYLGQKLEILVDNQKNDQYFGRTRSGKNVKIISSKKNLVGKFIRAKITGVSPWNLEATF
jgi:tRNA-2-methylthio-N6-dimethylallyladenosine synthase